MCRLLSTEDKTMQLDGILIDTKTQSSPCGNISDVLIFLINLLLFTFIVLLIFPTGSSMSQFMVRVIFFIVTAFMTLGTTSVMRRYWNRPLECIKISNIQTRDAHEGTASCV